MEILITILIIWFIFSLASTHQKKSQGGAAKRSSSNDDSTITIRLSTSGYSVPDRIPSVSPDKVWIPQGESIQVAGYTIPGGFLYVGTGLWNTEGWSVEPALIDPSLPVDKNSSDRYGDEMSYWPSYSSISPASRNAYLQWLADERKDPTVNIGYVFLYFYGLERRALSDAKKSSVARQEVPSILAEVKRLRTIYKSHSFENYTAGFINAIESRESQEKLYKSLPVFETRGFELPFSLKKGLAQLAADAVPLPPAWAHAWVESDPESRLRTPAYRCRAEFSKLFHIRYRERFGEGLVLAQKGYKLRGSYRPASSSFNQAVEWSEEGLLDVTTNRGTIKKLLKVAEECVDELDPYSRYLGRSGSDPSPLSKLALLPEPLLKEHQDRELQAMNQWLGANILSDQLFMTTIKDVIQHFPAYYASLIFDKREYLALCQLLAKLGVGIEPDARFGGALPESGSPIVLFQLSKDSASAPTQEYTSATVILHLAATVASSDGRLSKNEEQHLEDQLETRFSLSADERMRLRAHTQWLLKNTPSFSGMKKRLASFNQTQRETLGKFLIDVALVDGVIDPDEVKILNRIYKLLGLDSKDLYSHAHVAATEPVKIEDAEKQAPGFGLPQKRKIGKSEKVKLDMRVIEAKLSETAAVSAMLKNIFEEDAAELTVVQEIPSKDAGNLKYFETEYHKFIKDLSQKMSWARGELESLAAESNLLLDGALDSINDSAFNAFEQPFFEGEDPIEINPAILKEIIT